MERARGLIDPSLQIKVNVQGCDRVYLLKSVIERSMSGSTEGGHYTCDILTSKGLWTHCDDSNNSHIEKPTSQGYIFIYEDKSLSVSGVPLEDNGQIEAKISSSVDDKDTYQAKSQEITESQLDAALAAGVIMMDTQYEAFQQQGVQSAPAVKQTPSKISPGIDDIASDVDKFEPMTSTLLPDANLQFR